MYFRKKNYFVIKKKKKYVAFSNTFSSLLCVFARVHRYREQITNVELFF